MTFFPGQDKYTMEGDYSNCRMSIDYHKEWYIILLRFDYYEGGLDNWS
jgi:hypothetical protein